MPNQLNQSSSQIKSNGFTLIEMMTVIALMSIGLIGASSSLQLFIKRSLAQIQLHATTRQFIQDAHYARLQALQKKVFVSVLPVCGNTWDSGWKLVENAEFIASLEIPEDSLDQVLLTRAPLISTSTEFRSGLKKGNQFEDVNQANHEKSCASYMNDQIQQPMSSSSKKLKHLSFNPVGAAQTKNRGMVANRLVFQSRDYPEMEQHVLIGAGGRLRVCVTNQNQDCY